MAGQREHSIADCEGCSGYPQPLALQTLLIALPALLLPIPWDFNANSKAMVSIPRGSDLKHLGVESGHRHKTLGESKVHLMLGITKIKKLLQTPMFLKV